MNIVIRNEVLKSNKMVVACSGGIDSSVLLHILKNNFQGDIKVFHCNYRLRGEESEQDQQFVEELCHSYGIECQTHVVEEPYDKRQQKGMGIQEWARHLRRGFFKKFADEGYVVALGHTKDDLAENIFLKMIRGTSVRHGLGMSEYKDHIYRPLLNKSKADIVLYAKKNKLSYRTDSSNLKEEYRRNFLRLKIFPILDELQPGFKDRLIHTTQDASESLHFLTELVLPEILVKDKGLKIEKLLSYPQSVVLEVLSEFLNPEGKIQLSRDFLLHVFQDLQQLKDKKFLKRQLNPLLRLSVQEDFLVVDEVGEGFKSVRTSQHDKNFSQRGLDFYLSSGSELRLEWQRDGVESLGIHSSAINTSNTPTLSHVSCLKDKSKLEPSVRKSLNKRLRLLPPKERSRLISVQEKTQQSFIWFLNSATSKVIKSTNIDVFEPTIRLTN